MALKIISFQILLIAFFSLSICNHAKGQNLSANAEISLLTCSPGDELYSQFGHSALRIKDEDKKLDLVFGYGAFNFNTPNFYPKFARGKLDYMLSYNDFDRFKNGYIYEKRGITEQKLNLDSIERQKLFNALIINYKPENRYYRYDFLFDNCSTRIRDIVKASTSGTILFDTIVDHPKSFWNLLDPFMDKSRWIFLGIHLALGIPCDVEATPYQYMFLPDNMMLGFENAQIKSSEATKPLVKSTEVILKPALDLKITSWYKRPVFIFGIIATLGLILSFVHLKKEKNFFVFDLFIFGVCGLLGWLIIFLWFFTDHQATGPNWNIIWAFPLHFPMVFALLRKKSSSFAYYYFLLHSVILILVLGCWTFIPQSFPNEILPFVVLLLIRSLYIVKKLRTYLF
ncbi:Lnb N-terminal periplasmic domain-containing protein [Labilibaculum antarcticum]|uniref:Uncharacterized protein n=1 Tax=Labilibaculum antarcticum TaxID=1717717 RepID=A0A1Y1CMM3_9BACT|nr:DUF4105 domain-containing protein [Labilibaculum antarcticum]BAX81534.1 hypothetical protein ALGA_3234 [Labilibaculum antarcticum]